MLAARGMTDFDLDSLIAKDERLRARKSNLQEMQSLLNEKSKQIGQTVKTDPSTSARLKVECANLKDTISLLSGGVAVAQAEFDKHMAYMPNMLDASVPFGMDDQNNAVISIDAVKHTDDLSVLPHYDLEGVGIDAEAGARLSGSRFSVLKGLSAKLHRVLGQFLIEHAYWIGGYEEYYVPYIVDAETMMGTGQLPKFEDDAYKTLDEKYLIPTGEVSLTNLVRDQIIDPSQLPMRMVAITPCFRREAGSAGRDTRGLIRQHQFEKVELVTVCKVEQAAEEHQRILDTATGALDRLNLPKRVMLLCSGDIGFASRKTYDIEVWMPGSKEFREISSVSDCGDFQARRMGARTRNENGNTTYVNTLNGSGVAIGRLVAAVLETYAQGRVFTVPDALRGYFDKAEYDL